PTRLISKSPDTSQERPKNMGFPVNAPDADVFQLLPGDVVKGLNRSSEAQRVISELRYLEFYAGQIAKAVGLSAVEVVIIEDAENQTGFRKVAGAGAEAVHYGLTRLGRKRLAQVRRELGRED
ncbi:MAG: hypothetical protein JWO94_2275, partial [Verrucomicrobiaceae bacterium]|nr:hypothetical protein [Verrucomicrobiaceae bacterium]